MARLTATVLRKFGRELTRRRGALTQKQAAAEIGVHWRTYQDWEGGKREPQNRHLSQIEAAWAWDAWSVMDEAREEALTEAAASRRSRSAADRQSPSSPHRRKGASTDG